MKIKIAPTDGEGWSPTIEISIPGDDANIDQVWESLIRPALIAWGFMPETVDSLINGGDDVFGK